MSDEPAPPWWARGSAPQRVTWQEALAGAPDGWIMPDGNVVGIAIAETPADLDRALALYCAPCWSRA